MICALVFIFLNSLNSCILINLGFGVLTWQYWISMACVCGAYLAGALKKVVE